MTRVFPASRPARTAALTALLACSLTACAAGNDAVTAQFHAPADGVATVVGSIRVLNAIVVGPAQGTGPAVVSLTLANDSANAETVSRIGTDRFGDATLTGLRVVPAKGTLSFGAPTAQATATIPNFTGRGGESVSLDVDFMRAAPVRGLQTVVTPATGYYSDLAVPQPSASATLSPTGARPSGDASVTQSPEPRQT